MDPSWNLTAEYAYWLAALVLMFLLGRHQGVSSRSARIRLLEAEVAKVEQRAADHRRSARDLLERSKSAQEMVGRLQRSIVEMPEIAQRLTSTRDLREIPDRALELVEEVFDPSYCVFYRTGRDGLVAVASRGDSEYAVGHRVQPGEGVVGWTAVKQLPFTPEDARYESAAVRARNLADSIPEWGFSLCLPIVNGERTIGVILIGPSERNLPHQREIGRTIALIAAVTITSAVVLRQQEQLAKTDGLTGLLNKTHLLGRLSDLMTDETGPRLASVFLFDVDHFKHYNDTNGHLAGDELLQQLSTLVKESIRGGDLAGRYGGEEFVVVMPGVDKDEALRAADRIRGLIAAHDFAHEATQPAGRVSVSGGVASWPRDCDNVDALLRRADEALYQAKRAGRDRVHAFAPPELGAFHLPNEPVEAEPLEKQRED